MIWIPIIFVCLESCGFLQGAPEYSQSACMKALEPVLQAAQVDPQVKAVSGACLPVNPV